MPVQLKMELTRNLYRLEEVKASLTYSLLLGKIRSSLFWSQEILASECGCELGGVLLKFWIHYCCPYDILLPVHIRKIDFDGDIDVQIIKIVMRLVAAASKRPGNIVMEIISAGLNRYPWPCYTAVPTDEQSNEAKEMETKTGIQADICFKISLAFQRNQVARAWHFVARQDPVAITGLLRLLAVEKKKAIDCLCDLSTTEGFQQISLAACCVVLSTDGSIKACDIETENIPSLLLSVKSWIKKQGQRQGRIYAIEKEALYGVCSSEASLTDLYDIYPFLTKATPFWQRIVAGYDIKNDSTKEEFYADWFPDDIPDEWSLEDQQKSHRKEAGAKEIDPLKFASIHFRDLRKSRHIGRFKKKMLEVGSFTNMDVLKIS